MTLSELIERWIAKQFMTLTNGLEAHSTLSWLVFLTDRWSLRACVLGLM